jgi:nicotinamidase-related amidase
VPKSTAFGTLATARRLLDAARAAGARVVYTRVAWQHDYSDLHAHSPLLNIVVQQNCLPAIMGLDPVRPSCRRQPRRGHRR